MSWRNIPGVNVDLQSPGEKTLKGLGLKILFTLSSFERNKCCCLVLIHFPAFRVPCETRLSNKFSIPFHHTVSYPNPVSCCNPKYEKHLYELTVSSKFIVVDVCGETRSSLEL
ncbi:hypothetical protein ACH5RR_039331 [Cinchona calisaya]|uniref:Uncharacterized protein n=1 Tax=Cinchona calisaya TaxID=153742 RepID=A0ABD2Y3J6_9GENT